MRSVLVLALVLLVSCSTTSDRRSGTVAKSGNVMPSTADETFRLSTVNFDHQLSIQHVDGPIVQTDFLPTYSFLHCGTSVAYEGHKAVRATAYSLIVTIPSDPKVNGAADGGGRSVREVPQTSGRIGRSYFELSRSSLDKAANTDGVLVLLFNEVKGTRTTVTTVRFPPSYVRGFLRKCDEVIAAGPACEDGLRVPNQLYKSDLRRP